MRGLPMFAIGVVVGLIIQNAVAQNPNPNIVGLNHVALRVPNVPASVNYYTKTMGFPVAFSDMNEKGQITFAYVQISKNTFIELQEATAQRPVGINHFGLHVEHMDLVAPMFKQRGAQVSDARNIGG